jgi:hypothetical protein
MPIPPLCAQTGRGEVSDQAKPKRRLAYSVHDGNDGWDIVFANRGASAVVKGANALDVDKDEVEVQRIKWADSYAPGPVPLLARVENGWWMECAGCAVRIEGDFVAYDENDSERELSPVERADGLFCTAECMAAHDEEKRQRKVAEAALVEGLSARLKALVPEAEITTTHAYVYPRNGMWELSQGVIYFRFPGCKIGDATYRFDKPGEEPHVGVCQGDLAAWNAFRDLHPSPLGPETGGEA